jgi:hypothetical protein
MNTLPTVYVPRGAGPFAGVGRALKVVTGLGRPRPLALPPSAIGLGAVDTTNANLMSAAQALYDYFQTTPCSVAVIPQVRAFQQAWIDAGGTLPNDTGGRSPIDGYYGANTAAALQQMFTGAPNGCVGAASGGTGPAPAVNPTPSVSNAAIMGQDPISYYFADMMGGGPSLWWTLGIVGVVAVVAAANPKAFKMYPGPGKRSRPKKGKKRAARPRKRSRKASKRRASRGGKRGKRRRNPSPPPFSRSHARHEIVRPRASGLSKKKTHDVNRMRLLLVKQYGVPLEVVHDMDDEMVFFNYLAFSGQIVGQNIRYPRKWRHLEPPPDYPDLGDQVMETPRRRRKRR